MIGGLQMNNMSTVATKITSVSYIGNPQSNSAMYVTKKVQHLIKQLESVEGCVVFAENGVEVPPELLKKHTFIFSDLPQFDYAEYAQKIADERKREEKERKLSLTDAGYYIGENVRIGKNATIEPQAIIGHDVVIGDNAWVKAGAIIKNSVVGDDFTACEGCRIGMFGFTMAKDDFGNNIRIPTLGKVEIGNHVEVGVNTNISCGSGGNTIIEDYVKLDALVHVGHDVHIHKNAEIPAGVILGGYSDIGENVFIGINSAVRNRKSIGSNAYIGMGTVVNKNVDEGIIAVGNPVRKLEKESK